MTASSIWSTIRGQVPCAGLRKPRRGSTKWLPNGVETCAPIQEPGRLHEGGTAVSAIIRTPRTQCGVALVEFAIVFPILVTLVFSIWEVGRIFDAWLIVTNAAREGARYAITTTNDGTVDTQIQQYLRASYGGRLNNAGGDVTIGGVTATDPGTFGSCGGANDVIICRPDGAGGPVTVAITAHVEVFAPTLFSGFVGPGGTFDVHAWTTMD